MIMFLNKNAERTHYIKTDNSFSERVEEFYVMWKHFGFCTADNYRYF